MKKTIDVPFRELNELNYYAANTIIIGVADDSHASISFGASEAPNNLRKLSSYLPTVDAVGNILKKTKIFDYGNSLGSDDLRQKCGKVLEDNKFLIVFGGDHAISIDSQSSFIRYARKNNLTPVVLHFDAHADICDSYQDDRDSHACVNYRALDHGLLPENLTMFGIRSYEIQEVNFLSKNKSIRVFDNFELQNKSVDKVIDELKKKYNKDNYVVYLSFDIDVIDPSFAPGTGTPETFGLNPVYMRELLIKIINTFEVKVFDLVEISPDLDINDITSWLGLKLVYEVLSAKIEKNYK